MHRRGIRRGGLGLRAAALLGAGSLAVHELRYLVGCGGEASRMLGAQGHSYLALATTLAVLAFLVALAVFLAHVARGGENRAPAVRTRRLAPAASAALFAIYSVQELVEGLVATGHSGGLGGVYGNGGWTAAPFAADGRRHQPGTVAAVAGERMIPPIAHAGHWLTTIAYFLPVVVFLAWLALTQIRERRGRRRVEEREPDD